MRPLHGIRWSSLHTESFVALVNAGSDPFVEADDGSSAYSLLAQLDAAEPKPERAAIIERLSALKLALEEEAALRGIVGDKGSAGAQRAML
ncbi:MAG: hypothetical protein P4L91_09530 [Burkholderiaceae bacterium]|nr:hypothetical protein [Burkholderiaceae bacterium]